MKKLFRVLLFLLPLALFILVILRVRVYFDNEDARTGIFIMLGALVVLAVWMGIMIRCWLLPAWGRFVGERVYMSSYSPDDDPLVAMAERIRREHARELLSEFELLVQNDSRRPRAWAELATLLADEFNDPAAAVHALLKGEKAVPRKEDKALFLCRAAHMRESRMLDPVGAAELYAEAAEKYPNTAYGRKAGTVSR